MNKIPELAPKEKEGKLVWKNIPLKELQEVSKVFNFGCVKYNEPFTYRKGGGLPEGDLFDATMRHLERIQDGELVAEDSKCLHWAHIAANSLMAITTILFQKEKRKEMNKYIDNEDGTVTDNSNSLMWQATADEKMTWESALAYCEGLDLGGHTDWRLPTIKELQSIVDYSRYKPAMDTTYFPDTKAEWYWSNTTSANGTGYAWLVDFYYGSVDDYSKSNSNYVRAVRGGQPGSFEYLMNKGEQDMQAEMIINGIAYVPKSNMQAETMNEMPYRIVRTYSAGVFAGYVESRNGREVVMRHARRLWYWDGAASLSQLAMEGVKKPDKCKFPCEVDRVELLEVIEILDCTEAARLSIKGVPLWAM